MARRKLGRVIARVGFDILMATWDTRTREREEDEVGDAVGLEAAGSHPTTPVLCLTPHYTPSWSFRLSQWNDGRTDGRTDERTDGREREGGDSSTSNLVRNPFVSP